MSDTNGSGNGQPGADGAGTGTGEGANNTPWTAAITDPDIKGFAELKNWKGPEDAIKSYRELERFQGLPPERLAKVPDKDDVEGWKAFNQRFGWAPPETPDAYALEVPEGFDGDFAKAMSAEFHKLGVPPDLARNIAKSANAFTLEKMQQAEQALQLEHEQDGAKLKAEWGANFDRLTQLADRASNEIVTKGWVNAQEMELVRDALGSAKFMKLMANLGGQQGEAAFHINDQVQGGSLGNLTPEAAQVLLKQWANDAEWVKRWEAGGIKEKQEYARAREVLALAAANR